MKKLLTITLLSDLCPGAGDGYNSLIDTEVITDKYGIPYIPGSSLKGCIRESLLELVDMEVIQSQNSMLVEALCGKEGKDESVFVMDNARIENYEDCKAALKRKVRHPQEVLDLYTYTRTNNSIDPKTGTTEENYLRTTRVVRKGLKFQTVISFAAGVKESVIADFCLAAQCVKHIGESRTRGLGVIDIEVSDIPEQKKQTLDSDIGKWNLTDGTNIISYTITTDSEVLCKSAEGNLGRTQPYFEGNKMLGMVAGAMKRSGEDFLEFMKSSPIFSTAYISCRNVRACPVSASVRKVKDDIYDDQNKMTVYDLIAAPKKAGESEQTGVSDPRSSGKQLEVMGNVYVAPPIANDDQSLSSILSVDTEIHYHHRRPDDKSIGHATGKEDGSAFYQVESISADQVFKGYILADKKAAEQIIKAADDLKTSRIGQSKNTRYGAVQVRIEDVRPMKTDFEIEKDFVVRVDAPIIMYSENGAYSSEADDLKRNLASILGLASSDELSIMSQFLTYETIGGWNVTQGCRKPIITAIGRGSVLHFQYKGSKTLSCDEHPFIGERINEGYGEIRIESIPHYSYSVSKGEADDPYTLDEANWSDERKRFVEDFDVKLNERMAEETVRIKARKDSMVSYEIIRRMKGADADMAKLIKIFREQNSFAAMEGEARELKRNERPDKSIMIAHIIEKMDKNYRDNQYALYVGVFLQTLKYMLRSSREERKND